MVNYGFYSHSQQCKIVTDDTKVSSNYFNELLLSKGACFSIKSLLVAAEDKWTLETK